MNRVILFSIFLFTLMACNKSEPITSGESSLVYEAEEFVDLSEDVVLGKGRVYVENVSPYEDMFGEVLSLAFDGTTNGNDERVSDVTLSNVKVNSVGLRIYMEQADTILYHFKNARLILRNSIDPDQSIELATYITIDAINSQLLFLPNEQDLTDWMALVRPDEMYFEYEFNFLKSPESPIDVGYKINIGYDYSYESSEDK